MTLPLKLDPLTSLRFFAAAMIVISHAHPIFGSLGVANSAPLGQGVSFFFVLSGFILAYNYPALEGSAAIRRFWLARFARVFPLHFVTCMLWIAIAFNFDREKYFPGLEGLLKLASNLLLLQTWVPLKDWNLSFNGVSWSLSAELFFYACFPFLVRSWRETWHIKLGMQAAIIIAIIAASTYFKLPVTDEYKESIGALSTVYFNPLIRVFEFTFGIAISFVVRDLRGKGIRLSSAQWCFFELFAIATVVVSLVSASNFSGINHVFGSIAAYYFSREGLWLFWGGLIAVFALSTGPIARALSAKPLVFLGEISFSLYLCHVIVIHYLEPYSQSIKVMGGPAYGLFWLSLLCVSTALFIGVEQPARNFIIRSSTRHHSIKSIKLIGQWRNFQGWKPVLALCFILLSTFLSIAFRPTTIKAIDQSAVENFLSSQAVKQLGQGATFDGRFTILAVRLRTLNDERVEISVLLRSDKKQVGDVVLAMHLNDAEKNILYKTGDLLLDKSPANIPLGTHWVHTIQTDSKEVKLSKSIGIALYNQPSTLFTVSGSSSDWGGKRLIIPL